MKSWEELTTLKYSMTEKELRGTLAFLISWMEVNSPKGKKELELMNKAFQCGLGEREGGL